MHHDFLKHLYDPQLLQDTVNGLLSELGGYLSRAVDPAQKALPYREPGELEAVSTQLLDNKSPVRSLADLPGKLQELARVYLSYGTRMQSPRTMGHQVPAPFSATAAMSLLNAVNNPGLAVYEMAQFPIALERSLIKKLLEKLDWSSRESDGIITSGGSLGNLTALLAARNHVVKNAWKTGVYAEKLAIITTADSHYSVARSAGVLGIGAENVLKVAVDSRRKMDIAQLREVYDRAAAQGLRVFAVVGSACATPVGAFDPLDKIADFAREKGLWFHVDGAHGAPLLFSKKHRHLLKGAERADSVVWDAHKMMMVPSLCTFVLYRDKRASYKAFDQEASYLYQEGESDELRAYELGLRTVECTKSAIALPVWSLWASLGEGVFEAYVDQVISVARGFYEIVQAHPEFESAVEPECNIVCFRLKNGGDHRKIREKILKSGDFYITGTELNGQYWLRVTIMNPNISSSELKFLLEKIKGASTSVEAPLNGGYI